MNGGNISETLIFVIVIVLFMLVSIFLRRRSTEKTELGKVVTLLAEINHNQKSLDAFSYNLRVEKLKMGSWTRSKDKLEFLDDKLRSTLANTFGMAEDFNQRIDAARKHKSSSYLAGIESDKVKDAMTRSQQELGEWFAENRDKEEMSPKKRGFFG